MRAGVPRLLDRPIVFAFGTAVLAVGVTALVMSWGQSSPERVLIGLQGRHDGPPGGDRLAACLDCHVPFVGTPGSRCLGPGCHGELATGTPPRDGPAMPIRFHAVLRDQACSSCHTEHRPLGVPAPPRPFAHGLIPATAGAACARCHSGAARPNHPSTDAVGCGACHGTDRWRGVAMDHAKVATQPCDLCHRPPENAVHASIAGNCTECHVADGWRTKRTAAPAAGGSP